jgi:hypothetical protein
MFKAKVINVEKVAWNKEIVTLQGEDFKMIIELSNPEDHGAYAKGEKVDIDVKE